MDEHSVSNATTPPAASSQLVVALFGLTFVTGVIDAVSFRLSLSATWARSLTPSKLNAWPTLPTHSSVVLLPLANV